MARAVPCCPSSGGLTVASDPLIEDVVQPALRQQDFGSEPFNAEQRGNRVDTLTSQKLCQGLCRRVVAQPDHQDGLLC